MVLDMTLYFASIVSFCFPHFLNVSALSVCIIMRAFVVYLYCKLCAVFRWVWCEESACCFVWVENEYFYRVSMYVFLVGMIRCLLCLCRCVLML